MKQKIAPFLWFNNSAEEAAAFYRSVFKSPKNGSTPGSMVSEFEVLGQTFYAMNGNPGFQFTEAVSFMISCKDQEEVDYYWNNLSKDGTEQKCGWLKDKFGVSWQIIPTILPEYMTDKNRTKANNVLQAMLKMTKIEIKKLTEAYNS